MTPTVAQKSLTVKPGTDDVLEIRIDKAEVLILDARVPSSLRYQTILDLEDAITVARAILAFAGAPSEAELAEQARYDAWIEEQARIHEAQNSAWPAELSEL